jgi:hypothetical protein
LLPLVEVDAVFIGGSFGGFSATVAGTDGIPVNLSALIGQLSGKTGTESGFYDLVLDLQPMPSFTGKLLPAGYYAPMQEKLRGHWMYQSNRQVKRLKMCRTCRIRDALTPVN